MMVFLGEVLDFTLVFVLIHFYLLCLGRLLWNFGNNLDLVLFPNPLVFIVFGISVSLMDTLVWCPSELSFSLCYFSETALVLIDFCFLWLVFWEGCLNFWILVIEVWGIRLNCMLHDVILLFWSINIQLLICYYWTKCSSSCGHGMNSPFSFLSLKGIRFAFVLINMCMKVLSIEIMKEKKILSFFWTAFHILCFIYLNMAKHQFWTILLTVWVFGIWCYHIH